MSEAKYTPTPIPWKVGEYNEYLGYDSMTGGVKVGPICLDASDYGQEPCKIITEDQLGLMMADANLISEAVNNYAALKAQRDDLREALKYARRMMKPNTDTNYVDEVIWNCKEKGA